MRLKDRTALITGSSSGIGEAVALRFAAEGARRIVVNYPDARDADRAEAVVRRLVDLGTQAIAIQADVSSETQVAALVDQAEDFCGGIDILVNNAGVGHADPVEAMAIETWDRVIGIHLRGTFLVTRAVLPGMYARDFGRIINTASQLAYKGAPGLSAYTAAKGGILSFSRSLALEMGSRNLRINCVAPGATKTPILDAVPPDVLEAVRRGIPIGYLADVAHIAPIYAFLASSDGDHFQGQCISPNGGDHFL